MNLFENIIVGIVSLLFPMLCYLFYIVSNKNFDEKRQALVLKFSLLSIFYVIQKVLFDEVYISLLLTIPMFIAYKKNYKILVNILYILMIAFFIMYSKNYVIFAFVEMIIIYLFNKNKSLSKFVFIISFFCILYSLFYDLNNILRNISYVGIYVFICNLVYYTLCEGEEIINYHIEYKDLKKENEIRKSLFKITHEIKNPLAVCKAYVDMYDFDDINCGKKYIPIISKEIDKMLFLLQDFLLVNKDNINFDIMDINLLLEDINKSIMEIHHLKVNLDYDKDNEIYIYGDYNRLSQVLINLIKNSYEANASNVLIKSYVENENVFLEIIDNGDGICKSDSSKIYEPFYTTKRDGTGLGVPLSKEIIEAHNGLLCYYDNEIKGTVAKIILPLKEI